MFATLQTYVEDVRRLNPEKGWDGNVPANYKTKCQKSLGRWINRQRSAFAKNKLKEEYVFKLQSLGLKWSEVRLKDDESDNHRVSTDTMLSKAVYSASAYAPYIENGLSSILSSPIISSLPKVNLSALSSTSKLIASAQSSIATPTKPPTTTTTRIPVVSKVGASHVPNTCKLTTSTQSSKLPSLITSTTTAFNMGTNTTAITGTANKLSHPGSSLSGNTLKPDNVSSGLKQFNIPPNRPYIEPMKALKALNGYNDSMTNVIASKSDTSSSSKVLKAASTPNISTSIAGQGNSSKSMDNASSGSKPLSVPSSCPPL